MKGTRPLLLAALAVPACHAPESDGGPRNGSPAASRDATLNNALTNGGDARINYAPPPTGEVALDNSQFQRWLVPYLQAEWRDLPPYASRTGIKYGYALVDLNDDGTSEALVYVSGGMCGTGGCGLVVLAHAGTGWRTVTSTSIGYPPVQILPEQTNGWRDLAIYSRFDAFKGHQARLRFDGTSYPFNPSVPPAEPVSSRSGRTLIDDASIPLFPE